jgi:hypothetical protein
MKRMIVPSTAALAVLVALAHLPYSTADTAKCYYPNGDVATTYSPCNSTSGGPSACCELSSSACSLTGYCYGNAGVMYRGGCTDQSWNAVACPQRCVDGTRPNLQYILLYFVAWKLTCSLVNRGAFSNINLCPNGDSNRFFTCSGSGQFTLNMCSTNFTFDAGTPFTPSFSSTNPVSSTSTTSSTSSSTSATSTSTTAAAASVSCADPARTVGLAVGIPLAALAAFLTLALFFQHRRRTGTARRPAELATAYSGTSVYGSQATPASKYESLHGHTQGQGQGHGLSPGVSPGDGAQGYGSPGYVKPEGQWLAHSVQPPAELLNVEPVHELR